mgnify:CR=1 FL=1
MDSLLEHVRIRTCEQHVLIMVGLDSKNTHVREAIESLRNVQASVSAGMPEDFFSIDLSAAYRALGTITGDSVEDDVINRIFEKFCTGK